MRQNNIQSKSLKIRTKQATAGRNALFLLFITTLVSFFNKSTKKKNLKNFIIFARFVVIVGVDGDDDGDVISFFYRLMYNAILCFIFLLIYKHRARRENYVYYTAISMNEIEPMKEKKP